MFNNPLSYVDPSGFEGDKPPIMPIGSTEKVNPDGSMDVTITYPPRQPAKPDPKESGEQVGAFVPPVDVSTLGSSSGLVAQPVTTAPTSWTQHPLVQLEGGFLGGLFLGVVPFAGVGQQLLDVTGVLPKGTPEARLGLAIGQIVGGAFTAASGAVAAVGGGAVSLTGLGALIGVPVVVGSATAVVGGIGNMAAGVRGLMTTGSGNNAPPPAAGETTRAPSKIDRAAFKAEREAFWKAEAKNNPQNYTAEDLAKMEKGRAPTGPDGKPMELHHVDRTPEGGLRPMSKTEHSLGDNFKKNHP